jgi:hypothetical protein
VGLRLLTSKLSMLRNFTHDLGIKMNLKETEYENVYMTHLVQDRDQ